MSKKKPAPRKSGIPSWVKPMGAMAIGGTLGLVGMFLLPDAVAPYAPALGILASKPLGGGSWGKYLSTASLVGVLTFVGQRKNVQVAAASLKNAKRALASGGGPQRPSIPGGAAEAGNSILQKSGLK